MNNLPFDAIIFDHDGTLIDTESPDFKAWEMLYEEVGAPFSLDHWAELAVGCTAGYETLFAELVEWSNNKVTATALRSRLEELWVSTFEYVELMPGVRELLTQLRTAGYRLGVASASDRAWVVRWMTKFNLLPFFEIITTIDDVAHNKPAPDVYLSAAAKLSVEPTRCLVFEDSPFGIRAAKAAGMTVVAVPNIATKNLYLSQADAIVPSLQNVTIDWIEALDDHQG